MRSRSSKFSAAFAVVFSAALACASPLHAQQQDDVSLEQVIEGVRGFFGRIFGAGQPPSQGASPPPAAAPATPPVAKPVPEPSIAPASTDATPDTDAQQETRQAGTVLRPDELRKAQMSRLPTIGRDVIAGTGQQVRFYT